MNGAVTRSAAMHEELPDIFEHDEHEDADEENRADHVDARFDPLIDAPPRDDFIKEKGEPSPIEGGDWKEVKEAQEYRKARDRSQRVAGALFDLLAELVGDLNGPRDVGLHAAS